MNKIHQINQTNQTNQTNETNQINKANKNNKSNKTNQTNKNNKINNIKKNLTQKKINLTIIDFETTGLSAKKHGIIQIGAYSYYYDKYFNNKLNPEQVIWNDKAIQVHKIEKKHVMNSKKTKQYLNNFIKYMSYDKKTNTKLKPIFIAHNAPFDKSKNELKMN